MTPTDQPPTPRLMLTVEEAAAALRIGRTNMYALLKRGEIESELIGRLRRVPVVAVEAYIARLMAEQNGPAARDQ